MITRVEVQLCSSSAFSSCFSYFFGCSIVSFFSVIYQLTTVSLGVNVAFFASNSLCSYYYNSSMPFNRSKSSSLSFEEEILFFSIYARSFKSLFKSSISLDSLFLISFYYCFAIFSAYIWIACLALVSSSAFMRSLSLLFSPPSLLIP